MEISSIGRLIHRPDPKNANRPEAWSLLEMMQVVTLILIVASTATPIEAVSSQPSVFGERVGNREQEIGNQGKSVS